MDLWFPPLTPPVGCGQTRRPTALPVLTMACGYLRWAAAVLIRSRTAEGSMAGWWQSIAGLGAVPRALVVPARPTVAQRALPGWRSGMPGPGS